MTRRLALILLILLFLLASVGPCFAQQVLTISPTGGVGASIDANGWRNFKVVLTQNITSFQFMGVPPPAQGNVTVIFTENATGGFTVTFAPWTGPSGIVISIANPCVVATAANATTVCQFDFDGTSNTWTGVSGASLAGNNPFTGQNSFAQQITSTVATGTAPFSIASATNVPNLNASSLNGATFAAPGAIGGATPGSGAFTTLSASGQITSTVSTGTAPLSIASTTVVPNFNASQLGGLTAPASAIVGVSDTQTLTNKTLTSPIIGSGAAVTSSGTGGTMASQGVDINASNQVAQLHFGATAVPTEAAVTNGKMLNVDQSGKIAASLLPMTPSTCTMSSGSCSVNAGSLSAGSYHSCFASWNGTGTLTGVVKAVLSGVNNTCAVTSSVGTDTAVMNVYWVWSALP